MATSTCCPWWCCCLRASSVAVNEEGLWLWIHSLFMRVCNWFRSFNFLDLCCKLVTPGQLSVILTVFYRHFCISQFVCRFLSFLIDVDFGSRGILFVLNLFILWTLYVLVHIIIYLITVFQCLPLIVFIIALDFFFNLLVNLKRTSWFFVIGFVGVFETRFTIYLLLWASQMFGLRDAWLLNLILPVLSGPFVH